MTKQTISNRQVASLADVLSAERDAAVQFIIHGARDVDDASLKASYVTTDSHLAVVRSLSAWPSGELAHLTTHGDLEQVASVEAFTVALRSVRNRTMTLARQPDANVTLASLFTFYVDVNEFLLLSVAMVTQVLRVLAPCFSGSC